MLARVAIAVEAIRAAVKLLVEERYDPALGARPLRRTIEDVVVDRLAEMLSAARSLRRHHRHRLPRRAADLQGEGAGRGRPGRGRRAARQGAAAGSGRLPDRPTSRGPAAGPRRLDHEADAVGTAAARSSQGLSRSAGGAGERVAQDRALDVPHASARRRILASGRAAQGQPRDRGGQGGLGRRLFTRTSMSGLSASMVTAARSQLDAVVPGERRSTFSRHSARAPTRGSQVTGGGRPLPAGR